MSSSFELERQKTDPEEYHQVIALSVDMINRSLEKMWHKAPKTSLLREFKDYSRGEEITLTTGRPRVIIAADDSRNQHFFYCMKVTKGTALLYESRRARDPSEFSLNGAEFVFPVTMASELLKPGNPDHNVWATSTGFTDEAFSISRLYLQFTKISDVFDDQRSTLPDELKNSPGAVDSLRIFLQKLALEKVGRDENLVGIQIQPKNDQAQGARTELAPTSMEYIDYPWKDGDRIAEESDDRHCLCILSMTNFEPPPRVTKLDYSGPFTERGATLCLNRKLFWQKWLLEDARTVLQAVHIIPLEPYLGPPVIPQMDCVSGPVFAIGSDRPISSYTWTPSGNAWRWEAPPEKKTVSNTFLNRGFRATDEATSRVEVNFTAGGRTVIFTGDLTKTYFLEHFNGGTDSKSVIEAKWTATFDLFACKSGTIAVTRATTDVRLEPLQATHTNWWKMDGNNWKQEDFSIWQGDLQAEFGTAIRKTLGLLTNSLQRKLEDQHRLFLPGGGAFNVRDPVFNARGDLLVTLEYHDFDPPKGIEQPQKESTLPKISTTSTPFISTFATSSYGRDGDPVGDGSLGHDHNKCLLTHNACGDEIPLAWRVVPHEQQFLPERDPLIPHHELQHETGKVVSTQIAVSA